MTGRHTTQTAPQNPRAFRLPDIPEKHPDDMTSSKQLAKGGNQGRLESHLGNPETTIVSGERYICAVPGGPIRYPDLLVAFDADPELYEANNGYVVSFQGKPPELALEIASRHTARIDVEVKPDFYASLGVREYWRFDETGEFHGARLAGDRLVDGQYHPIVVEELPDGELRGYSDTLGLYFCWRQGDGWTGTTSALRATSQAWSPSVSYASRRKKGSASWKQSCVSVDDQSPNRDFASSYRKRSRRMETSETCAPSVTAPNYHRIVQVGENAARQRRIP